MIRLPPLGFIPAAPFVPVLAPVVAPAVGAGAAAAGGIGAGLGWLPWVAPAAAGAGAAAGAALGGLIPWGPWNGPPRYLPGEWKPGEAGDWQPHPQRGELSGSVQFKVSCSGALCEGGAMSTNFQGGAYVQPQRCSSWRFVVKDVFEFNGQCDQEPFEAPRVQFQVAFEVQDHLGLPVTISQWGSAAHGIGPGTGSFTIGIDPSGLNFDGEPIGKPLAPSPWVNPWPAHLPKTLPPPQPLQKPDPAPEWQPPQTPPKEAPPAPATPGTVPPPRPALPPVTTPVKAPSIPGSVGFLPDGKPLPPALKPPVTTPSDSVFPGGIEIRPRPPQPNLTEVAKEVGRLEQKLDIMLRPQGPGGDQTDRMQLIMDILRRIFEGLMDNRPGGSWYLDSPCVLNDEGNRVQSEVKYSASSSIIELIEARTNALAALIQTHKDLKQPICFNNPRKSGNIVTVLFESDEPSEDSPNPLRKVFSYANQVPVTLDDTISHWEHFVWQAGPVIVVHRGTPMGALKVYASSENEGRRVINHAASIAGIDTDKKGEWIVTRSKSDRYGKSGTMRTSRRGGLIQVSMRDGASGPPLKALS